MKLKEIESKIGKLSNPSKMPAYSWGIPASRCITGSKLVKQKRTVCSGCYALTNCYVFPVVKQAYENRYQAIHLKEWVDYMVQLLTIKYKKLDKSRLFHRWFDSGDLQSVEHLQKILEVCRQTPHIKHWIATRESPILAQIKESDVPSNVVIRLSATKIDGKPPKSWSLTSTVHRDSTPTGHSCPSLKQDGECRDCRACWNKEIKNVSYKEH